MTENIIGIGTLADLRKLCQNTGMSSSCRTLWNKVMIGIGGDSSVAQSMLDTIADILPIALTVAGSILVVTLGWRLFRNFTRG